MGRGAPYGMRTGDPREGRPLRGGADTRKSRMAPRAGDFNQRLSTRAAVTSLEVPVSSSAAQRRLRAQLAAHSLHAGVDSREHTARARSAFLDRFRRQVDPNNVLSAAERDRRAQHALRAHMLKLALRSARARAK
jgi:hypothetical protein